MAINAATQWEVRTTGDDANGGGFKAGASGTDRSQQDAAHATLTTAATVHTTTTQINVPAGEFTVSAADVGNLFQNAGGTSTAGFYEITAVDVPNNRWTVDRAVGTAGQTVAGNMGGALLTINKATGAVVAGNTVWVKAGTYSVTASVTVGGAGLPNGSPLSLIGYNATRGDTPTGDDRPLISTSSAITVLSPVEGFKIVENFRIDGDDTATTGVLVARRGNCIYNVKVSRCTTNGFSCGSDDTTPHVIGCEVTDLAAGATAAFNGKAFYDGCYAHDSPGIGFFLAIAVAHRCIAAAMGSHGFQIGSGSVTGGMLVNCVAYNNGGSGLALTSTYRHFSVINSIFALNAAYGISGSYTERVARASVNWNAFYSNTSGARDSNLVAGASDVTLTADPFTNAAGGDFSLNNTAGGGAALRALGFPGVFPGGTTTGYPDIGAAQHQDKPAPMARNIVIGSGVLCA